MTNTDPCRCSCHKPGIGSNGECCDCHLGIPYMDGLKIPTNKEADALNENFEYCNELSLRINELAGRIDIMAKLISKLTERVLLVEKQNEQRI